MKTVHDLLLKDVLAEYTDEDDDRYVTVVVNRVDEERMHRLCERTGKLNNEVIAMALKFYEDALNAV